MSANTTPAPLADPSGLRVGDEQPSAPEVPCACRFVLVDGAESGCTRTTKRTFAPGHDAQLKSRLIEAALAGSSVEHIESLGGGVVVTGSSPAEEAGRHGIGPAVAAGIARRTRLEAEKAERRAAREAVREANRATREAAKADAQAKREAKAQQRSTDRATAAQTRELRAEQKRAAKAPKLVTARVGRWPYEGTVDAKGRFVYKTKAGDTKKADQGGYVLL